MTTYRVASRRPETQPDGAAGAGDGRGRDDRRRPRAGERRHQAGPAARAGRRHGRHAQRGGPPRAARAAQPRLQPRPAGGRRALRPADRRRRPALPGRQRTGDRRHRRPADAQGRPPGRTPRAAALVRAAATGRARRRPTPPEARRPRSPTLPRRRRPPRNDDNGTDTGWLVAIAIVAALAAFFAALAASTMRRPGPRARRSRRRSRRWPHELYLEGRSADERVADFRGNALATTVTSDAGRGARQRPDLVPRRRRAQARTGVGARRGHPGARPRGCSPARP